MGRWEPDAAGRLKAAAVELYIERGYENTTVADIADRAGVTTRTFFRYFNDKREVLFSGSWQLQSAVVAALHEAPAAATPMEGVWAALETAATLLGQDHRWSRTRHDIVMTNSELQERELIKMASMAAALADGLRTRGIADPRARLAAELGVAVLRVAFDRWVDGPATQELHAIMRDSFDQAMALLTAE